MELKNPNFFNEDGWDESKALPSIDEIKSYLKEHFRYWTMNSWNALKSYAHNVKLYNLGMEKEDFNENKVYDFIFAEHAEYDMDICDLISMFETDTDDEYTAVFNGRSDGYLVLCEKRSPCRSIDAYPDELDEFNDRELIERFKIVKRFDTLADDIRAVLFDHALRSKTRTIKLMKPENITITLTPDETDAKNGLDIILKKDVPDYEIRAFLHPLDKSYHAYVPELEQFPAPITGESLEECIMHTEKAILEYLDEHPDAPEPKRRS